MTDGEDAAKGQQAVLKKLSPWEIRSALDDMLVKELHGPAGGAEEEVSEGRVSERYMVGMLAPKRSDDVPSEAGAPTTQNEDDDEAGNLEAVGDGTDDPLAVDGGGTAEDGATDLVVPQRQSMFQSSFGMTFTVDAGAETIYITARWGHYERRDSEHATKASGDPKRVWKRVPVEKTSPAILFKEGRMPPWVATEEFPGVVVEGTMRLRDGNWIVTLFLVNNQPEPKKGKDEAWLFQAELSVEGPEKAPIFRKRAARHNPAEMDSVDYREEQAMDMAYRRHVEFAVGHGVAVHADTAPDNPEWAVRVATRAIPRFEVSITDTPTQEDNPNLSGLVLDMKELSETPDEEFGHKLGVLADAYEQWIQDGRQKANSLNDFKETAEQTLRHCDATLERIREGIALLAQDEDAAKAFRFANKAMWQQRVRTIYAQKVRRGGSPDLDKVDIAENRSWRPFQLAFILLNLPSVTDPHHEDRSHPKEAIADLLWFPTGGGKTEAYLGLAAYVMGLRRLQGTLGDRSGSAGVAVLMRYTLRLLTLQQFQRAATLICACEIIRKEDIATWGKESFRIGLWVGQRTTPNRTEDSAEAIRHSRGQGAPPSSGDPHQLNNCPWCGTTIERGKHMVVEKYPGGRSRTFTYCGDELGRCPFSQARSPDEGIPILVVDDEIYRRLPTLLIATVDKFAQMPWDGRVQMLFGQVNGYCTRHGFRSPQIEDSNSHPKRGEQASAKTVPCPKLRPPDLIIQDELHLISGPLGTLVGLYETAVDELCSWDLDGTKVRPKVIASTATIRRAADQIRSLFLRKANVFPPQGLDVRDNFFSIQREPSEERPGRLYLGICAPGIRQKAALIRVYTALLAAGQKLYSEQGGGADPWMTLVGYFNSIRELAGMRRLTDDDIRSRLGDMDKRGLAKRRPPLVQELTSRLVATQIPAILDQLEAEFDPKKEEERKRQRRGRGKTTLTQPIDVLLATNMLSVGVDVQRLGLMVVAGQPKTTAEYIQATSRVGRRHPGLVVCVHNWAKPRDLSHYERFEHYHATFYKHVEALSVTPFSSRALDRGLSALLVSLIRLPEATFNDNGGAEHIDRDNTLVTNAFEAIIARADGVVGTNQVTDEIRKSLQRRLDVWMKETQKKVGSNLGYRMTRDQKTRGLLKKAGLEKWEEFTCLNSLRDVEPSVNLVLDDHNLDE